MTLRKLLNDFTINVQIIRHNQDIISLSCGGDDDGIMRSVVDDFGIVVIVIT